MRNLKIARATALGLVYIAGVWGQDGPLGGSQPDGVLVPIADPVQRLNENCVVSILNRTIRVNHDGTWLIPDVPANFGPVRARATCVQNGVTTFGQSDLFTLAPDQSITLPHITLGPTTPIPLSLNLTTPASVLTQAGQTSQLTATAVYAGSSQNVTPGSSGTQYLVSNPAVATVTADGLVTAVSSGTAVIQAQNEGAQGLFTIQVALSVDSDGDGIPDDAELRLGLNPHDPTDALLDLDHDGLTNLQEYQIGTDLRKADTDGMGSPTAKRYCCITPIRLSHRPTAAAFRMGSKSRREHSAAR